MDDFSSGTGSERHSPHESEENLSMFFDFGSQSRLDRLVRNFDDGQAQAKSRAERRNPCVFGMRASKSAFVLNVTLN